MTLKEVVPFFAVSSMERSVAFYVDGLGFKAVDEWRPDGDEIVWCMLRRDSCALMLQRDEGDGEGMPEVRGAGVTVFIICEDAVALYREFRKRGIDAQEPFVGNHMWVTSLTDPDGYRIDFESLTDVPEETKLSDFES